MAMTMEAFEYNGSPSRVVFGAGSRSKLPAELSRLNVKSPVLLSTPEQRSQAEDLLKMTPAAVGIFSEATMHTPTHVTEKALAAIKSLGADGIVSIGGGSTTGLGKAVSIRTGLPHLCIPTTYAGSEMTPILGETAEGVKTTRREAGILPATVIYDVELTMSLPTGLTATSGVNAIAHAVEALYAPNTNPLIRLFALDGIRALTTSLPTLVQEDPHSIPARNSALYGAWLCGICLGSTDMSLHHKLCHVLGGSFNLPHAETHTVVLPHALAYNAPAVAGPVMRDLAEAIPGSDGDAVRGLNVLLGKLGVKRGLRELGMQEADVEKAVGIALRNPYKNPRAVEEAGIRELIRRAWAGEEARPV